MKLQQTQDYLFLIDEKAEIKDKDYFIRDNPPINFKPKRFIKGRDVLSPTTKSLKIIGYSPLNSEAKELDLPLLPNPFKEVNIEELSKEFYDGEDSSYQFVNSQRKAFITGYKEAQSKQFSLEDMKDALNQLADEAEYGISNFAREDIITKIIQSLSTQKLPKEFISEYEYVESVDELWQFQDDDSLPKRKIKTITNSSGKIELVGTYKY